MGTGFDVEVQTEQVGIIPRAIHHLFKGIEDRAIQAQEAGQPVPEFKIVAQFMELYNEDIIDLFDPSRTQYAARVSMNWFVLRLKQKVAGDLVMWRQRLSCGIS
jgi:kinesin family protein 4/21/27